LSAENRRFEKILLVASPRASVWSFGWRMIPRAVFHFYVKVPALWRFRTKLPLAGLGMGGHVPARVAAECASLLRSRQFERGLAHLAMPTTHFGNFTGDLLSLCFSDDPLATLGPTHGLARLFTNASAREVREIDPRAFALPHISHLGFFHGRCRDRVWPGVVDGFLA
jgi:predicted alpha/beta hydrolase